MGLLLSHKRKVRVWPDMFSVSGIANNESRGGGTRGEIEVFSAASRYRLFRLLHQLEFERVTFITLTYPADFPEDIRKSKAHLKEWRRLFEVAYGKYRAVWRLEFQKRGAPHYHIMYLDIPFIPVEDLCWTWKRIVHSLDMAHEINGVDVKLISDRKQQRLIASYVGKYIAKVDERKQGKAVEYVGRWWGRWNIEEPKPLEFTLTDWEAIQLVTIVLGSRLGGEKWQPIDPSVCSIFGSGMGSNLFGEFARRYAIEHDRGSF